MSDRKDDWDELLLRYLGGEADAEQERRVRERLLSDESARARLVSLACQQQALADVLSGAAGRKSSTRLKIVRPNAPRTGWRLNGWLLAAVAVVIAVVGILLGRSSTEPPAPRQQATAPNPPPGPRPPMEEPKPPRPIPEAPPAPPVPALPAPSIPPEKQEPVLPVPAPRTVEKAPDPPRTEEPKPAPTAPKPEAPTRVVVTEQAVATLQKVEGEVTLLSTEPPAAAAAKQSIRSGQGLQTGAGGSAEFAFPDGTRIRLEPGTVVREITDGDKKGKRLFLAKGGLWADVRKQPADQPMTLTTPNGEARILGTRLRLFFDEKTSTRLEVEEGKVRLKSLTDGKSVDVTSGHFAVAAAGTDLKALPSILSGLVGYWRFDDAAGATMVDASGQGNHGTLVGKSRRTLGRFAQALELDGATTFVRVPHVPALDPGSSTFSLSIWVRNRKETTWAWQVFFKDDEKLKQYYYLSIGTKPRFEFSTGDAKVTIDGQAGVNDNRWHHLVAVRTSAYSAQLYVDGVLDSTASVAPSAKSSIQTTTPLTIGAGDGSFYAGQLDDARVYNRALSAEEVRQLFAGR